ncbi:MAG: YaiO family outer membrane beta-barrel protein [bacterium]
MPVLAIFLLLSTLSSTPLSEADSALARGDWEAAIRDYRLCLEKDPSSYEAQFGLAQALSFSGKHSEAIQVYTNLLSTHPDDPDARLGRGRVYAWERQFEEAETDLTFVTEKHPEYTDAWSALGDVYLWSARPDQATEMYTRCIEQKPDEPAHYIARAKAHRNTRRFAEARKDLDSAHAKDGDQDEINQLLRELQRVPGARPWEASANYSFQSFNEDRADWHTYNASIRRTFERGSLALETIRTHRFSEWDEAAALDGYLDLWPRAYGNLRLQFTSDADVLPRNDSAVEVFQGFGPGWEISASYRNMDYPDDDVDLYGASLGKYIGNWYLRGRTTFLDEDGSLLSSHAFFARRYLETVDDFIEVGGGRGKEVVTIAAGPTTTTHRTHFYTLRVQKFLNSQFGVTLSANYEDQEDLPVGRGFSIGIITRW